MRELKFIEWEQDGAVATVWLNRPPVNATDGETYTEIKEFFDNVLVYVPDARAVVLAARGEHFCAGNDLSEFQTMDPANAAASLQRAREAFWAIYDCPLPIIAAVQGVAVGSGLAIAASCDVVIAAEGRGSRLPRSTSESWAARSTFRGWCHRVWCASCTTPATSTRQRSCSLSAESRRSSHRRSCCGPRGRWLDRWPGTAR